MANQKIIFKVGRLLCAVSVDEVHEIIQYQQITYVPTDKAFIKGIINLRGEIIPIISLARRLELKEEVCSKDSIIILDIDDMVVGMTVNEVLEMLDLEVLDMGVGQHEQFKPYIEKIGLYNQEPVLLLNTKSIIGNNE